MTQANPTPTPQPTTTTTTRTSTAGLGVAPTWAAALGVVVLFFAVRAGDGTLLVPGLGLVLVVVGLVLRGLALGRASTEGVRQLLMRAIAAHIAVVGGGVLICLTAVHGLSDDDMGDALLAFGLLLVVGGIALIGTLELLMGQTRASGFVDEARVQRATSTAVTLVAGVAALAGIVYGVQRRDVRFELAFAAPTSPSGATLALVDTAACGDAKEKPEAFLFFERGSTALGEVRDYFDSLAQKGVRVTVLDQALDPPLAKALKVTKNGYIALRCGEKSESYNLGPERDDAQKKLGKLDEEVRNRLGKVTRDPVTVYMTVGHGERTLDESDKTGRSAAKSLKKLLEGQNVKPKKLGIADGLTSEIPKDAGLVVVLGPQQPFLPEEARTLAQFVDGGGSLALFLDPPVASLEDSGAVSAVDVAGSLQPLLAALSLTTGGAELVNEKEYVKQSGTGADHVFVFSSSFGSHKAVKTLNGARGKAALLFLTAQSLARVDGADPKSKDLKVSMIARSRPATWSDTTPNRKFDEGSEKKDIYDFAAVVEKKIGEQEARALVVGDSDVVADVLLANEANAVFAYETFAWLLRDDSTTPASITVNEDTPIRHTRDEDSLWFYGTVLAGPAVLIALGLLLTRGRRGRALATMLAAVVVVAVIVTVAASIVVLAFSSFTPFFS